jgi:hypothetical protein
MFHLQHILVMTLYQAYQKEAVPGTFIHMKWFLVPQNLKDCCIRYS